MSDFDDEEAWRDLCSIWRWSTKGRAGDENKSARQKWDSLEDKESLWPDIRRAVLVLNEGLPEGGTYPHRLWGFLNGGWENHGGAVTAKEASAPAVVAAPVPVPVRESEPDDNDFEAVFSEWPPNPGFPEKPSAARAAWAAAVSQHGKVRVVKACRAYMEWVADTDSAFPRHLRNFLGDAEDVEIWSAREVPDLSEVALFEAAWGAFPHRQETDERKPEGRVLFFRNVATDDRLYFVACCRGYARQMVVAARTGEEVFALGFARFTREWKAVRKAKRGFSADCTALMVKATWAIFDREKLDPHNLVAESPMGLEGFMSANGLGEKPAQEAIKSLLVIFATKRVGNYPQLWYIKHKVEDVDAWATACAAEVEAAVRASLAVPIRKP
jgi:hypothetical protein